MDEKKPLCNRVAFFIGFSPSFSTLIFLLKNAVSLRLITAKGLLTVIKKIKYFTNPKQRYVRFNPLLI